MSDIGLTALTLTNFRSIAGAVVIPLEAPVVLLYGPNGSGKTSVMSGLEFALTGHMSEVPESDHQHLVHRGAEVAELELATSAGPVMIKIDGTRPTHTGLLSPENARFFSERCYLGQRKLGRLLEIYERQERQRESPLTGFVKDLLGLDQLDALIDGLEAVQHKSRIKKLVPQYDALERAVAKQRKEIATAQREIDDLKVRVGRERTLVADYLGVLDAPGGVDAARPPEEIEAWLRRHDEERSRLELEAARDQLAGLSARHKKLTRSVKNAGGSVADREQVARDAVAAWQGGAGAKLENVFDDLRRDAPAIGSAIGASEPRVRYEAAMRHLDAELAGARAIAASDGRAEEESARAAKTAEALRSRIKDIDDQLGAGDAGSLTKDLANALAAVVPHLHGDNCPVCGRDYREVADEPLAAHIAARVSELGERAERLQGLAAARLEAASELSRVEQREAERRAELLDEKSKADLQTRLSRLESSKRELTGLDRAAAEGAELMQALVAAERDRATASEAERTAKELSDEVRKLGARLDLDGSEANVAIEDALPRLERSLAERLAETERRQEKRARLRDAVNALADASRREEARVATVAELAGSLERSESGIRDLEKLRAELKRLREDGEANRGRIIKRVFNDSLNRVWQDLFVRLVPDEPFVPRFSVPDPRYGFVAANFETVYRDGSRSGSPAAMLSAGNLNTAALTLFLALNLSVEQRLPWLLLDDPVQSMDEVHVAQFAAVLRTLVREHGKRLIVAVHEEALFDYLKLELSPGQPGGALATIELGRVDETSGARQDYFGYTEDRALVAA